MRIATRFRLLLLHDIGWVLFFFACFLSDKRMAKFISIIVLIVAEQAGRYAQRMIGTLTLRQMRTRATVTVIRYLAVSGFLVWIDFTSVRGPSNKAPPGIFSLLVVPVLLVLCYMQVRLQLGLEPLMQENEPKPPNQTIQPTAGRSDV